MTLPDHVPSVANCRDAQAAASALARDMVDDRESQDELIADPTFVSICVALGEVDTYLRFTDTDTESDESIAEARRQLQDALQTRADEVRS